MLTKFYFVRHAETDLAGTFCGTTDPPVNERGREQLERLVAGLEGVRLDAIYTSDLLRATTTADALAASWGTPVHLRAGLRQIDFGAWETMTWEQIEQADRGFAARWVAEFPNLPPPGGEPIPAFKNRVLTEVNLIRQQVDGGNVAVVTHSTVLRVLLEELGHFAAHHAWEKTRDYTCVIRASQYSAGGGLTFL